MFDESRFDSDEVKEVPSPKILVNVLSYEEKITDAGDGVPVY